MGRRQILDNIVNTVIDLIKKDAPVNKVAADIPPNGLLNDAHVQTKIMDGPAEGYIYNILDTKKGKNYVGSKLGAIDKTENYLGSGTVIKNIANKRPDDLYKTILGKTKTRRELMQLEEAYLQAMRASQDGNMYNLKNSYRGQLDASQSTRDKISAIHKGKKVSVETRNKISKSMKGRHVPKETREKISKGQVGVKRQPLSKEHAKKIGDSNRGKKRSTEQSKRMSKANIGISRNKGRVVSEEQKKKLSDAAKLQWKRQKGLL